MKEKSLIETAKMQGNVMVRWLYGGFPHTLHDADEMISWLIQIFRKYPVSAVHTRVLTHDRSFGNWRYFTFTFGFCGC